MEDKRFLTHAAHGCKKVDFLPIEHSSGIARERGLCGEACFLILGGKDWYGRKGLVEKRATLNVFWPTLSNS